MISNRLVLQQTIKKNLFKRFYTCIVERHEPVPIQKLGQDQRKYNLKSRHFHYKLVECTHTQKWGNIDLILTDYVEGVGHKGEIVNVSRHLAYYELLPAGIAVYPTEEYLEMYKKDRESLVNKSKVSPFAIKTKEQISNMILDIPMNLDIEWDLSKDNIRIALRYNQIMCTNESIQIPDDLIVNSKNCKEFKEPFIVKIKINDYVQADLKCRIVGTNMERLWEDFSIFNKAI